MTPQSIYRLGLLLTLELAVTAPFLYGQSKAPADTLRRNLTVLTSESIELGEDIPDRHSFVMSKPKPIISKQLVPSVLPQLSAGLKAPALVGLGSLQPTPPIRPALGYASASLGLAYSAQISAGIRPINTESRLLDLHLAAHWSRYKYYHTQSLPQVLAQSTLRLGISYKQKLNSLYYKLQSSYYTDHYPAFGIVTEPISDRGSILWDIGTPSPLVRSGLLRLSGEIGSRATDTEACHYRLTPSLAIGRRALTQDVELELDGRIGYELKSSHLALDANLAYWNCSPRDDQRHTLAYTNLAPSWSMEQETDRWSWRAKVGAKLSFGSRSVGHSALLISPNMSASIGFADWVQLSLNLDGGISGKQLSDVIDATPYLRLSSPKALTHTPWSSRLSLDLLPLTNLSIVLSGSYTRHRGAEGIAPTIVGQAVIGHHRYYENANHWSIGTIVRYRTSHWLEAEATATYHHWQTDRGRTYLGGKPTLDLGASLNLTPNERYRIGLAYHLSGDYRYPLLNSQDTWASKPYTLGIVGRLTASASYLLTSKISLLGYAHYITTTEADRAIGFPEERFRAIVGVNWIF